MRVCSCEKNGTPLLNIWTISRLKAGVCDPPKRARAQRLLVLGLLHLLTAAPGPSATSLADPLTTAPEGKAVALFVDEQGRM